MKQQKPIIHGADHVNGVDPIPGLVLGGSGALEWEDVGTTSPPFAEKPLRYLYLSKYIYNDVPSGVLTPINFHVRSPQDAGYTPLYNTNDTTGGASDVGLVYTSAWLGDCFYSNGTPDGDIAFKIRPDNATYLLEVVVFLFTGGAADYHCWLKINAPVTTGDQYQHGAAPFGIISRRFAMNDNDDPRSMVSSQSIVPTSSASGDIPVSIALKHDAGSTSVNGPSVVMMRCIRLSPKP